MPTTTVSRLEDRYVAAFSRLEGPILNGNNARLQGLRRDAIERFAARGLPTQKDEAWKYTNIEKALRHPYAMTPHSATTLTTDDLGRYRIPGFDAYVAVLVDGRFDASLSTLEGLPQGVTVAGFAQANDSRTELLNRFFARYADLEEPLVALNTAFTRDGLFVHVPAGTVVEKPIHVLHIHTADTDVMLQPRLLFAVEDRAQLRLIETCHSRSDAAVMTNAVTEVFIGREAHVDHYKVQDEGPEASQVHHLKAYQQEHSFFSTTTITLSGALVRNNLSLLPDAEHCETHLYGLYLGAEQMHVDTHTLVDHAKPNCFSNELYKGILDGQSTGVFNGKVFVRRDAQQTNAYQSNKTLVLTDAARIFAKPELEIYADDVKCSHGATTGQLDREAVFYLRSRGLTEGQARAILMLAFARDVIENIKVEPLRAFLDAQITERFHATGG